MRRCQCGEISAVKAWLETVIAEGRRSLDFLNRAGGPRNSSRPSYTTHGYRSFHLLVTNVDSDGVEMKVMNATTEQTVTWFSE